MQNWGVKLQRALNLTGSPVTEAKLNRVALSYIESVVLGGDASNDANIENIKAIFEARNDLFAAYKL